MFIYVYTCIYMYMYICIYLYIYIHVFLYIHVHIPIHIHLLIYMYIYIYTCTHACAYSYACTHSYIYVQIHIHIFTYIYIYIYMHEYMYIHMRVEQAVSSRTNPQHSALCRIIHVLPCTSETLRDSINNSAVLQNGQTNPLISCVCLCPPRPPQSSQQAPPLESESACNLCAGPIFTHEYTHTRAGSGRVCGAGV